MNMNKVATKVNQPVHKTVLLKEAIDYLNPVEGGTYVDATVGLGGHSMQLLEMSGYRSKIIGLDVDEGALMYSEQYLKPFKSQVTLVNKNFVDIDSAVRELGVEKVDGIIADLGMSSFQLENDNRGFSFSGNGPLDMRMDIKLQFTAFDLLNEMTAEEIEGLIKKYGEESFSKRISESIVKARESGPLQTSAELAEIVSNSIPKRFHSKKRHPATKTFQALRIAVNNEIDNLKIFIEKAVGLLKSGGRLIIISFHSLEDRVVKNYFKEFSSNCICPPDLPVCGCQKKSTLKILTKSPIRPSEGECLENPRCRSAKMRIGERI